MKKKNYILLLPVLITLVISCNKKGSTPAAPAGQATLIITPSSAGSSANLTNTTVYIKSNTLTPPAAGVQYDSAKICNQVNGLNYVTFKTLANGNYHLYAQAYDTSLHADVQGDLGITISSQSSQSLDLPMVPPGRTGVTPLIIIPQRYYVRQNLINGIIYIKYNTALPPANGIYDDTVYCLPANNEQVAVINNMARGNYYIHAVAYDTSISSEVEGDKILQIASTDSIILYLPVLE